MLKNILQETIEAEKKESIQDSLNEFPRVVDPTIKFSRTRRIVTDHFEKPEFDFTKIMQLSAADGYLEQSFNKKESLFMKEGYDIVGENQKNVDYVKKRLSQIAMVSKISTDYLVSRIASNVIRYNNSLIVKVRKNKSSGGFIRNAEPGKRKKIEPVAAYFPVSTATMEVKTDDIGNIKKWRQWVNFNKTQYREYSVEDIIHIHRGKEEGFIFAMPQCWPVLNDIDALRHMEENIEMLVHQTLFPIIHYRVGTDNAPARTNPNGINEVESVQSELENMPPEGIYITSERHELKMIGSEGRALRAEGYLNHFKNRVFAGLAMSSVDFGEGGTSNRSTAETMSRSLIDEVKSIQLNIENFFNQEIIDEILLEAGFNVDITEESEKVYLKFKEIDIDSQTKKENAVAQKWLQNLITIDEARIELGYEEMNDEKWKRTNHYLVARDLEEQSMALKNSVENKNRPANQHGKKTGPQKSLKDSYQILDYEVNDMINDIVFYRNKKMHEMDNVVVSFYKEEIKQKLNKTVTDSFDQEFLSNNSSLGDITILVERKKIIDYSNQYIDKFFNDIEKCCKEKHNTEKVKNLMDSIAYRIEFIKRTESQRARNWARVQLLKQNGIDEYKIKVSDNASLEKLAKSEMVYNTKEATIETIPPFHPNDRTEIIV